MSLFAGILRTEDLNRNLSEFDPEIIETAIAEILAAHQAERNAATSLLVARETTDPTSVVREAGLDEGQEIGEDGRPLETHVGG